MSLCNKCQDLLPRIVLMERISQEKGYSIAQRSGLHHDSLTALLDAANACRLCNLIKKQLNLDGLDWLRCEHPLIYEAFKQSAIHFKIMHYSAKGTWIAASLTVQKEDSTEVFEGQIDDSSGKTIKLESHLVVMTENNRVLLDRPAWNIRGAGDFDVRLSVVRGWLEACLPNPDSPFDCSEEGPPFEPPILPKRVIDAKSTQSQTAKLVCKNGERAFYTTLSYCWGGKLELTARGNNIGELLSGFSISSLPKTYQDAIEITRALGIQYLWIDALCIIQDDETEVQEEIAKMADIYRHSRLTIAASGSATADGGCIHPLIAPVEATSDGTGVESANACKAWIRASPRFKRTVVDPSLNKRAWTLQENILSPRVLYCAEDQLYWQCGHRMKSEDGLVDEREPAHASLSIPYRTEFIKSHPPSSGRLGRVSGLALGRLSLQDSAVSTQHAAFDQWYRIVNDFTSRTLTYPEDRLRALAGIIDLIKGYHFMDEKWVRPRLHALIEGCHSGNENLAGLWLRDLHLGLAWKVGSKPENRADSRIGLPSWSWASINGPIAYEDHSGHKHRRRWFPDFKVLEYSIKWSGQPISSRVLKADLKLQARLRPLHITPNLDGLAVHIDLEGCQGHDGAFTATLSTEKGAKVELDRKLESSALIIYAMYLYCQSSGRGPFEPPWMVCHLLLLALADEEGKRFSRVGVGKVPKDPGLRLFEGLEKRELTLI